jgi:hypothetical protein
LTLGHGPKAGLHAELVCPSERDCPRLRFHRPVSPVLGAVHAAHHTTPHHTTQTGIQDVHHQGNQAAQDTDDVLDGQNHDRGQDGIGHSIRPATAVPLTVLVAEMLNGSLLLQGWRDGPSAYLCPADAAPLKRELAAAFGNPELKPRAADGAAP